MIDLSAESVISFADAAGLVPCGRGSKPTHVSTVHRWARSGVRGVRLEAVRLGGRWLTSVEALQRFADRLTCGPAGVPTGANGGAFGVAPTATGQRSAD